MMMYYSFAKENLAEMVKTYVEDKEHKVVPVL
jgi:hypothetical protein